MSTAAYIKETRQHLNAMRTVMAYCMRENKTWDEQSGQQLISGITCLNGRKIRGNRLHHQRYR